MTTMNATKATMTTTERPVTERANELTVDMDVAAPSEFVGLLGRSDAQMFDGFCGMPSLFDISPLIARASEAIAGAIAASVRIGCGVRVVMAGAGTSGRLAWAASRDANASLVSRGLPPCCRYLIAGDDLALLTSQESAEDDVVRARNDLKRVVDEARGDGSHGEPIIVFIGITCGLSAPCVAAQLAAAVELPRSAVILVGFNPVALARKTEIEGWPGATFHSVASDLLDRSRSESRAGGDDCCSFDRFHVLTPVYGPESLAGSTRMKGGSTTKILLDALLSLASSRASSLVSDRCHESTSAAISDGDVRAFIGGCRAALNAVYGSPSSVGGVSAAVGGCSAALRCGGRIFYFGGSSLGVFGVIDASECVPTYGARPDEVRAFIEGGWSVLANAEGNLSRHGGPYRLAIEDFSEVAATVTDRDAIVVIGDGVDEAVRLTDKVRGSLPTSNHVPLFAFAFVCDSSARSSSPVGDPRSDSVCRIVLPPVKDGEWRTAQHLAAKLVLNAISTGSFTSAGKVFRNRMVDLRISNVKLCRRAYDLVSSLTGKPADEAERCVLRAIHGKRSAEEIEELRKRPLSDHVKAAYQLKKVVPIALLIASGVETVDGARKLLEEEPVVRTALLKALSK